jgi:hypothetical protein
MQSLPPWNLFARINQLVAYHHRAIHGDRLHVAEAPQANEQCHSFHALISVFISSKGRQIFQRKKTLTQITQRTSRR